MSHTLIAIDQGTTGTTALLVDSNLTILAQASEDFPQHFPKPGWVEHDPDEIWATVERTVAKVAAEASDRTKIAGIGITNQRETVCFWDRRDGRKLANAIVWQDRRTAEACEQLRARNVEPFFHEATGLILDPYFSGTKVAWALKHWDAVKAAEQSGNLAVGTIDSFLAFRITGGKAHVTEPSNASRTLAFNIAKGKWNPELCKSLGVPVSIWPEVLPSAGTFGVTKSFAGLPDGIPISGILGDQQAALLGQACVKEGMAKCTYGTGAFVLMNTGKQLVRSRHRLLSTVAWSLKPGETVYALEGSAFIAGAAVQWLRDGLGFIKDASEIESLARSVDSADGVVFVPALTGLGAPYWNPHATGMFTGLTRGTGRGHLARATLEGIAFQISDLLVAMQKDLGKPLMSLNVDGGAAANDLLMQFQSGLLQSELRRPQNLETTSLGALFAAGLGVGVWKEIGEIEKSWREDRTFRPEFSAKERDEKLVRWHEAVARVNFMPAKVI